MLVAVLASYLPEKIPTSWAYLTTVTRASRNFEGTAWEVCEAAGEAQKAARGEGTGSCIGLKRKTSAAAGATQTERQIEADQMEEG